MAVLALLSTQAVAGNYAKCLLKAEPKAQNDFQASDIEKQCASKYPGGFAAVPKGAGKSPFFSFKSPQTCIDTKAKNYASPRANRLITAACEKIYG